jgi:hypothetical protein
MHNVRILYGSSILCRSTSAMRREAEGPAVRSTSADLRSALCNRSIGSGQLTMKFNTDRQDNYSAMARRGSWRFQSTNRARQRTGLDCR